MACSRRAFCHTAVTLGTAACLSRLSATFAGVEIGACVGAEQLKLADELGFDYLEPGAAAIAEMDENRFQQFKKQVEASRIKCESFNSFIRRPELKVVGENVSRAVLVGYLEPTLARCRELAGSVVVWGSAGSRNVPPGFSRQRAWEQIREFLTLAGDIAQANQLIIGIEPLRKQESNIINRGSEALQLVREVRHPNVKMIIDYYHLRVENEDPQIVWEARKEIVHFHFANPRGRLWPKNAGEDAEYGRFFGLVKKIGYRGGISLEGNGTLARDGAASLGFFREELA